MGVGVGVGVGVGWVECGVLSMSLCYTGNSVTKRKIAKRKKQKNKVIKIGPPRRRGNLTDKKESLSCVAKLVSSNFNEKGSKLFYPSSDKCRTG